MHTVVKIVNQLTVKSTDRALNTFGAPGPSTSHIFKALQKAHTVGAILISNGRMSHRAVATAEKGPLLIPRSRHSLDDAICSMPNLFLKLHFKAANIFFILTFLR